MNSFIPGGVASSWTGCHVSMAKSFLFSQKPLGFTVKVITETDLVRWELYIPLVKAGPLGHNKEKYLLMYWNQSQLKHYNEYCRFGGSLNISKL